VAAVEIMFATATTMVGHVLVRAGEHWWVGDPLVVANPSLFSPDPRVGLRVSTRLPDDLFDQPVAEPAIAGPRRRAREGG
jgi:hypothetical protein